MSDDEKLSRSEDHGPDPDTAATPLEPTQSAEGVKETADQRSATPPLAQRVTRRTIHRSSSTEEVAETITEDVSLVWAPPPSGYPSPVG